MCVSGYLVNSSQISTRFGCYRENRTIKIGQNDTDTRGAVIRALCVCVKVRGSERARERTNKQGTERVRWRERERVMYVFICMFVCVCVCVFALPTLINTFQIRGS